MIYQHRRRLLLVAVLTVTVPGVLAICAALLQDGGPHRQHATYGAAGVESAAALAAAAGQAPRPVLRPKGQGLRLLAQAASASLTTSYQGIELVSRWNVDGTDTALSNVWHQAGGLTLMQTSGVGADGQAGTQLTYDSSDQDPEGVFGVTMPLVALLASHYTVQYTGQGSLAGRSALVVAIRRTNGSVAARFWLDKTTKVPLGREEYDLDAGPISDDVFIDVKFGTAHIPRQLSGRNRVPVRVPMNSITAMEAAVATGVGYPSGQAAGLSDWTALPATPTLITSLRAKGWAVPTVMPGGLSLYSAALSGQVVDLGYSDGLFAVSLFVQHGHLAAGMAGVQQVAVSGHEVYSVGHGIVWGGRGFVYTMLADAPPRTVEAAVAILPHDSPPGFWRRLGRGLGRLASMVDPFR